MSVLVETIIGVIVFAASLGIVAVVGSGIQQCGRNNATLPPISTCECSSPDWKYGTFDLNQRGYMDCKDVSIRFIDGAVFQMDCRKADFQTK